VIPVVDLRAKFGMAGAETTDQTCIIVVEISQSGRKFSTGIVVDHVQEVLDIDRVLASDELTSFLNTVDGKNESKESSNGETNE